MSDTNAGGAPEKVGDNLDHSRELVAIVADTNIELIGGFQKSQDTFWASVPVEINAQAVRCRFLVECNHCSVSHIFSFGCWFKLRNLIGQQRRLEPRCKAVYSQTSPAMPLPES